MTPNLATMIMKDINSKGGPQINIAEAMSMTPVKTDELVVFALQKGDVTFLAWVHKGTITYVTTQIISW